MILKFNGGVNNAKDRSELKPGELQQCVGGEYRPGDQRLWKSAGRSTFGDTGSSAKVKAVQLIQFDSGGTDRLLAFSGTTISSAPGPGATGTFTSLITGMNSSATHLSAAHYNDRWYLANGYDDQRVVESDGTVRTMGMAAPQVKPVGTPSADGSGESVRPSTTATSGTVTDAGNAIDASGTTTFAGVTASSAGSSVLTISGLDLAGTETSSHRVEVVWALAGSQILDDSMRLGPFWGDAGGSIGDAGWNVTIKIEVSEDGGSNYTEHLNRTTWFPIAQQTAVIQLTDSVAEGQVYVRCTLTYNAGVDVATFRIHDCVVKAGSTTANFSTDAGGLYYAVAEADSTRGLMSPIGPISEVVNLSTQNMVTLTLPAAAQNSNTDEYVIFRTADGGAAPRQLGELKRISSDETSFIDDFATDHDTQPLPIVPLLSATINDESLYWPRDKKPPLLDTLRTFRGSLVGTRDRSLHWSIPGLPESWPEPYAIVSFPLEEHDVLVDTLDMGGTLLIGCQDAMLRTDDLPRFVAGTFAASPIEKIPGAPGIVGRKAFALVAVRGVPLAAWISQFGIYVTDGQTVRRISDSIDWTGFAGYDKSDWVLHWDHDRHSLLFCYGSSGGQNDRYYLLNMHPDHRAEDGAPKVTGPHYGDIADLTSGVVSNTHRLYSGHTSNGIAYTEKNGTTDTSNAYDSSSTWPLIVQTGRIYHSDDDTAVLDARLAHTDFGSGQTISVAWTTGRDHSGGSQTRTQTVSLSGQARTPFDVARSGEYHEVLLTHTGAATGAIQEIRARMVGRGKSGKVSIP